MGKNIQKLINLYIKSSDQGALDELKSINYFKVASARLKKASSGRGVGIVKLLAQDGRVEAIELLANSSGEKTLPLTVRSEALTQLKKPDSPKADDELEAWINKLLEAARGEPSEETAALFSSLEAEEKETFIDEAVGGKNTALVTFLLDKSADKSDRKLIKKAVHKLKAAGEQIDIPEKEREPFRFKAASDAKSFAKISYIGMQGFMGCVFAFNEPTRTQTNFLVNLIYPETLISISKAKDGKKGYKEVIGILEERFGHPFIEVTDSFAAALITNCVSEAQKNNLEPPNGWLALSSLLEKVKPQEDIFEGIEEHVGLEGPLDKALARRSNELLDIPIMRAAWVPPEEILATCMERLKQAEVSTVVIDDNQRLQQFALAFETTARETVETLGSENIALRMELNALILGMEGKKQLAQIALAIASDLKESETPEFLVEVLRALFKVEKLGGPDPDAQQTPSSPIIQPDLSKPTKIILPGQE